MARISDHQAAAAVTLRACVRLLLLIFPVLGFRSVFPQHPARAISLREGRLRPLSGSAHTDRTDGPDACTATENITLQSLRETLCRMRADLLRTGARTTSGEGDDRNLSPDEYTREALMTARIPGLALSRTRLGPSTIPGAGRGLFASRDIAGGDVVTCYPGDALLFAPPDDGHDEEEDGPDEIVVWAEHVNAPDRWDDDEVFDGNAETGRPLTDYAFEMCGSYSVLALPALDADPAYSGHFSNDGAGHHAYDAGGAGAGVEEGIAAYVRESLGLSNAVHMPVEDCHVATVATRDIVAGEEIFVTYGPDYWLDHGNQ